MFEVVQYPNQALQTVCSDVIDFSEIGALIERMARLMYEKEGVGLAAPQVADFRRIIVLDPTGDSFKALINPTIEFFSPQKSVEEEGCLSIPNKRVKVTRSSFINVKYSTTMNEPVVELMTGLEARIVQHEIDHLNGLTIARFIKGKK